MTRVHFDAQLGPTGALLVDLIEETMKLLATDAKEIVAQQAQPFRNNPGPNESGLVKQFNDTMISAPH